MSSGKQLLVTFRLDASHYEALGDAMVPMARQDVHDMIFKRAEMNLLWTMMQAALHPSGNDTHDRVLKAVLEAELEAVRSAAGSATYEIIDA
jgi:hypothetical protein